MREIRKFLKSRTAAGILLGILAFPVGTPAADQANLSSVIEEAQIQQMADGSGKYLMKSNGFYCLNPDGTRSSKAEIHYFDQYEINGTTLDGYYYHDADGKFRAGTPYIVNMKGVPAAFTEDGTPGEAVMADGIYMVNNLGKLSAAPQVRYLDNLAVDGVTFNGYYYFDNRGRLVSEPGIHHVQMVCGEKAFDGSYYFGGANGALIQENTVTSDGFVVDETGRISNLDELGMENLQPVLEEILDKYDGDWSIYVKDLNSNDCIVMNDSQFYSASLIKAFVMAKTYEDMDEIVANQALKMNAADLGAAQEKVDDLLWNMITVSDNESCNELVRLQTPALDFRTGAEAVNEYLEREGYTETSVQHTLHPSASESAGLGGRNLTSVKDCGLLLERIYRGTCVNREASESMLNLLLNQEVRWKIPTGLPAGIVSGNKTGETDEDQHDIAIIYGETTTYILCVMSEKWSNEDTAVKNIRDISRVVYNYLNLSEKSSEVQK